MEHPITWLGAVCLVSSAVAIALLVRHLVLRPPLTSGAKLVLLFALGVLPAVSAVSAATTGMQETTERRFCGSCHTMDAYVDDSGEPDSQSLAARHGRNPMFGARNCYVCHADYGMYGYPLTKLNGMRHVYEFYLGGWKNLSQEEAHAKIHLLHPYQNQNCRQCHSGTLAGWSEVPEHKALEQELDQSVVSCASGGCHGFAHPFTKNPDQPTPALTHHGRAALPPAASARLDEVRERETEEQQRDVEARELDREAELERAREAARERSRKAREQREQAPKPEKAKP